MKAINLIIIGIVSLALLTPVSDCLAKKKQDIFNMDKTYSMNKNGTIFLTTEDADVKIVGSDREDVHLVVHYESHWSGVFIGSGFHDFDMEVTEDNGNLHIREISGNQTVTAGVVNRYDEVYTVDLEVPKGASLQIRGEDDDYNIDDVGGQIDLTFEDGDAMLKNCTGDRFEFDFEDGDLELRGGTGNLEAYCEDGTLIIDDGDFKKVYAECEDGDIDISTKLAAEGNYELRCEDGDIDFEILEGGGDFRVTYEDGRVRASSAFDTIEDEDHVKEYKLPDGNAEVRIRVQDGDVRLIKP